MEMGSSGSLGVSGACGSSDSLNVLKFGQKIYFEDAVGGGGGSSSNKAPPAPAPAPGSGSGSGSGSSAAAPAMPPKKGKGVAQGAQGQPPRCQVEGCKVDLTGAKAYYCRHKVCGMHSKAPKVVVGGQEQRFCQQCSRFHQLSEFDQGKRSCRRRLAGHNERRRKPPPGPLSSRYGHLATSFSEDPSRFRSFLMDFTYPRLQGTGRDVWPTVRASNRVATEQWQGGLGPPVSIAGHGTHSYIQGSAGGSFFSAPEIPRGECLAGVSDSSCALSLLSNQTWGGNTAANQAPAISASSSFGGTPIAESMAMSNYMTDSRRFRVHGDRSSSHEIQHQMGLGMVSEASNVQFSGELELALQGNDQSLDHGTGSSGRVYDHSGPMMHWSL